MRNRLEAIRRRLDQMPPLRRKAVLAGSAAGMILLLALLAGTVYLWKLARQFPRAPFEQPSRLYAQVPQVAAGDALDPADLAELLAAADYREVRPGERLLPGTFRREAGPEGKGLERVAVSRRHFPTPEGMKGGNPVEIDLSGKKVLRVREAGRPSQAVILEPPLLASYYTPDLEERRPVTLGELPEPVVQTVLAAEDDSFFVHPGVSVPGIVRALWVNLRGGELQGGSTITQQLVKNVYLSQERTLSRKAKEALIAMMLEVRYGKRQILEAYLNEIYLGRSGQANLIGFGAAARAYFGKEAASLTLAEAATLAGMIQAPAQYLPTEHPQAAVERRNWVLGRLGELGWVDEAEVRQAQAQPLRLAPRAVEIRALAPYFSRTAAAEARERYGLPELAGQGYLLFSTLDWLDQRQAERSVRAGLAALDKGGKRRRAAGPLQAALISVDPRTGGILAYVGGRDYEKSQFDRVTQARRQAGSAFKPVVYAAAFQEGVANPAALLKDSPIVVKVDNADWRPQNYDRRFHGMVTVRTALEQSLNIPTIRLALQTGLGRVIDVAKDMGVTGELNPVPALALGAFEMSPREMAEVYATLANGGLHPVVHGLETVLSPGAEPLEAKEEIPAPQRVVEPQAAYLVTSLLQGVLDHGTGAGYGGKGGVLAGKTGTTNDRRDNWFAGYSPDRATVVWVGYDDNRATGLSGATAALPVWSRFVQAVRPPNGYPAFAPPPGVVTATIDPTTGQLATPYCPTTRTEVFPEWQAPGEPCQRHAPGGTTYYADSTFGGDPLVDPETGEPLSEYGYTWSDENSQIEITPSAAGEPAAYEPAAAYPDTPGTAFGPTPVAPAEAQRPGAIVIQPSQSSRPRPQAPARIEPIPTAAPAAAEPAEAAPAAEPEPALENPEPPPPPGL
ncbi:MAG TPA: PBP1A family penicillin-binding protein [Thermoanaerobaculia bacterium]|nr:PBP1A family penicillin-binding protein [Thermoanaerobaculia bacterium]